MAISCYSRVPLNLPITLLSPGIVVGSSGFTRRSGYSHWLAKPCRQSSAITGLPLRHLIPRRRKKGPMFPSFICMCENCNIVWHLRRGSQAGRWRTLNLIDWSLVFHQDCSVRVGGLCRASPPRFSFPMCESFPETVFTNPMSSVMWFAPLACYTTLKLQNRDYWLTHPECRCLV